MKASLLHFVRNSSNEDLLDVLFLMVQRHPEEFEDCVKLSQQPKEELKSGYSYSGGIVYLSKRVYNLVGDYSRAGQKVSAIKEVRTESGIGLKEAKDFVEETFFGQSPRSQSY